MNHNKSIFNKESPKIRRRLNRHRRRITRQTMRAVKIDNNVLVPVFKNTSGWITW